MRWMFIKSGGNPADGSKHAQFYLYLDFPPSTWNKNKERHILELDFFEYRKSKKWALTSFLDYEQKSYKYCVIRYPLIQHIPKITFGTNELKMKFEDFTIEFCKEYAINHLKNKLLDILYQMNTKSGYCFNFES